MSGDGGVAYAGFLLSQERWEMLTSLGKFERSAQTVVTVVTSLIPIAVVGGLLYAAFFVKAVAVISAVRPPAIERRDSFLGVALPADKIVWAAGSNGKIIRSDDNGANWSAQPVPVMENLQGIAAWDADQAVAVGGGAIIRTADGGKTWKQIAVPSSEVANKLLNVRAYANGSAWAVGELGAVLKTADFGQTWVRALPEKDQAWNDISFSGGHGILVGEFGQVMTTEDGGSTWQTAKSGVQSSLMSVYLRDASNGVAVGLSGVVLTTRDGGSHWSVAERQTREHLNNVLWDGERWIAVGDKGLLVTGDAQGAVWKASRVSEGSLGWNTQIVRMHSSGKPAGYVLAGASLSRLDDGRLTVFGHAAE
jgi:photosystem II stability/assembly factor-like uncharacterized protein